MSYRSSPTQLTRVMFLFFGLVLIGAAGLLISDSITGRKTSGPPIPFAVAGLMVAAFCGRASLAVLTVFDDHIRIVNWLRSYNIPRASGLQFSFGNETPTAPLLNRSKTYVVLSINAQRTVNVAALMLGNTRLGVEQVHQMVDDLNARMRTWDSSPSERAETN